MTGEIEQFAARAEAEIARLRAENDQSEATVDTLTKEITRLRAELDTQRNRAERVEAAGTYLAMMAAKRRDAEEIARLQNLVCNLWAEIKDEGLHLGMSDALVDEVLATLTPHPPEGKGE
jgi:chromosome segregation ATPase